MMDLTMRAKLLPAPYIIKNFVGGEDNCNYEIYLLELLNSSAWFSAHYPGGFTKPSSESHGECDAINQIYQIDFKLLASKTALQARSVLSDQVHKMGQGVIGFGISKLPEGKIQATRLFAAFRGKSLADLYCIRKDQTKVYGVENDILTTLKMLETKKNLLLFFPYEFTFDQYHNCKEAIKSISEALTEDFHVAFEYRDSQIQSRYDTFMTCIYEHSFLIFSVKNRVLKLVDTVETEKVSTFLRLSQYTDWW